MRRLRRGGIRRRDLIILRGERLAVHVDGGHHAGVFVIENMAVVDAAAGESGEGDAQPDPACGGINTTSCGTPRGGGGVLSLLASTVNGQTCK